MDAFGSFLSWLLPCLLLLGWVGAGLLARAVKPFDRAGLASLPKEMRRRLDI